MDSSCFNSFILSFIGNFVAPVGEKIRKTSDLVQNEINFTIN